MLSFFNIGNFIATGSGIASDDSTVVLCFNKLYMLGMAKPGDHRWMLLEYKTDGFTKRPLMFAGCFYHVNVHGVMVLQFLPNQPPRLEVAVKLNMRVFPLSESMHLFNNCGELMLMHDRVVPFTS
uniref:F-box associated domain-containing protein n=1 Tax=Triticum urartu TaxID=4572 RepID=A0A8R7PWA5_TRIUA